MDVRTQTGLVFSLGSIPVLVRPAFFIVPLIFGWSSKDLRLPFIWLGVVFVSVLVHELGHALTMKALGFAPQIELHGLGGLTYWPQGATPAAGPRFLVTFMGPSAGLLLGLVAWVVQLKAGVEPGSVAGIALNLLKWANFVWSIINLMPVLPWDGGHAVDSGLEILTGQPRPRLVGVISMVVASGIVAFAARDLRDNLLLAYFGVMGIVSGWRRFNSATQTKSAEQAWQLVLSGQAQRGEELALQRLRVAADPDERARLLEIVAWARLHQRDVRGAREVLDAMQDYQPSVELRARLAAAENDAAKVVELLEPLVATRQLQPTALPLLVSGLLAIERPERAAQACRSVSEAGRGTPPAMQAAVQEASAKLFHAGAFEAALDVCALAFERFGQPVHAFNAACCLARLGRLEDGLAWLERAVTAGYAELETLEKDEDLAPLRTLAGYPAVIARAQPLPAAAGSGRPEAG